MKYLFKVDAQNVIFQFCFISGIFVTHATITKQNHNFELVFKEHLHFHESLYLLNIRGMFLKNFIVIV